MLVPLRIPSGWTVAFNRFEEVPAAAAMSADELDASWDDIAVRFDHPDADVIREAIDLVLAADDLDFAQTVLDELT